MQPNQVNNFLTDIFHIRGDIELQIKKKQTALLGIYLFGRLYFSFWSLDK